VTREVPTVEVDVDGGVQTIEVLKDETPVEKKSGDLAVHEPEGAGDKPVFKTVKKKIGDQEVGTGDDPVLEAEELRTGAEPVLEAVEMDMGEPDVRTGDEPVHETVAERTRTESVEMGTGDVPVHDMGEGDFHFENFSGDDFEKAGEFTPEETPQTPADPAPAIPSEETPSSAELRRKRIKTLAGRTDLPWVRKLIAQMSQTSPSSQKSSHKQPFQPTRKSHRLAAQGSVRRGSTK